MSRIEKKEGKELERRECSIWRRWTKRGRGSRGDDRRVESTSGV
jgi:hypothetical protein